MQTKPGATGPNEGSKQHGQPIHHREGEPEGGEAQTTASGYGQMSQQQRQPGVIGAPGGSHDDTPRAGAQQGFGTGASVGVMTEPAPQTGGYGAPMASTAPPPDMPPAA